MSVETKKVVVKQAEEPVEVVKQTEEPVEIVKQAEEPVEVVKQTKEYTKETVSIKVDTDMIGLYLGKNASELKKHVIVPSKKEYFGKCDPENKTEYDEKWKQCKMVCIVKQNDDRVCVECTSDNSDSMNILKKYLKKYTYIFNKKLYKTYCFDIHVSKNLVGKLIGVEGSNINLLKNMIKKECKYSKKLYIKFNDRVHSSNTPIHVDGVDDKGHVGLTISLYGPKYFSKVKSCLESYLVDILVSNDDDESDEEADEEADVESDDDEIEGW